MTLRLGYQFTENWAAHWRIAYAFGSDILLANAASVEYLSKCNCWALGIEIAQNRQFGVGVNLLYRVVGLGNDPTSIAQQGFDDFGFLNDF